MRTAPHQSARSWFARSEAMKRPRPDVAPSVLALTAALFASLGLQTPDSARQVASTGTLRVVFLAGNPTQGRVDAKTGAVSGPVKELSEELGKKLGVPVTISPLAGVPAILERLKTGTADIGFVAIDSTRAVDVDFSQPYLLGWSSYLVPVASALKSVKDVDRAGIRIAANSGDAPALFLARNLKAATLSPLNGPDEALEALASGRIDAYATNRQRLSQIAASDARFRVLDDNFFAVEQALAVPKGRAAALHAVNEFLDAAKASGLVRGAIERAGLTGTVDVAPPRQK
jgi:polar amino acid transport system substrate-binding protein